MENLQDVLDLMKPGVWVASIDLHDAYYTIPVNSDNQKVPHLFLERYTLLL